MSGLKTVTGLIRSAEDLTGLSGLQSFSGEDSDGIFSYSTELNSFTSDRVELEYPTQNGYDYSYRVSNRVYNLRESWIDDLETIIDWDSVPIDTLIKVRNSEDDEWVNGLFAKYDPLYSQTRDLSSKIEFYYNPVYIGFKLKNTLDSDEVSMFELIDGGVDMSPAANLLNTVGISSGFYVGESGLPAKTGSGIVDVSSGILWSVFPNYFSIKYLNNTYDIVVNSDASNINEVTTVINNALANANGGSHDLTSFIECYKINSIGIRTKIKGEFSELNLTDGGGLLTTLGIDTGIYTAEGSPLDVIDVGVGTSDFTSGFSWSISEGEYFELLLDDVLYKITAQGSTTSVNETILLLNTSLIYSEYDFNVCYFVWNDWRSSETVLNPDTDFTGYRFADLK